MLANAPTLAFRSVATAKNELSKVSVQQSQQTVSGMGVAGGLLRQCLQVIVDALVRSSRFVKGGVSVDTLPTEHIPEVASL